MKTTPSSGRNTVENHRCVTRTPCILTRSRCSGICKWVPDTAKFALWVMLSEDPCFVVSPCDLGQYGDLIISGVLWWCATEKSRVPRCVAQLAILHGGIRIVSNIYSNPTSGRYSSSYYSLSTLWANYSPVLFINITMYTDEGDPLRVQMSTPDLFAGKVWVLRRKPEVSAVVLHPRAHLSWRLTNACPWSEAATTRSPSALPFCLSTSPF